MPAYRRSLIVIIAAFLAIASAQQITVRPGDTLWALANRHGTSVEALREANDLETDSLKPGMVLRLPTGSEATPSTYTVREGDTLYDIAVAFDLSMDDLIAFNDLDGSVIRPGQVLNLSAPPGGTKSAPLVVTVKPGDTLWGIAREHETTPSAIASVNGIAETATLRPGTQLTVPGRYAGSAEDQGGASAPTITIGPGDNLWAIARRYNTTVAALMSANDLRDTNLHVGQTLKIVPGNELVRALPASPQPPADQSASMVWPLLGAVTSKFGYRSLRIGGSNLHYGIDIDGDVGEPIRAAVAGVVTYSGWRGGYGNMVVIEADNTEYYYAHASELLVKVGDVVAAGQAIAKVGATGRVTGSHLHFEIRVDGSPIDPLPVLQSQARR